MGGEERLAERVRVCVRPSSSSSPARVTLECQVPLDPAVIAQVREATRHRGRTRDVRRGQGESPPRGGRDAIPRPGHEARPGSAADGCSRASRRACVRRRTSRHAGGDGPSRLRRHRVGRPPASGWRRSPAGAPCSRSGMAWPSSRASRACGSQEVVRFECGIEGIAFNLLEHAVGCLLLGPEDRIEEGSSVERTGRLLEVPVGDALIGRMVNALGQADRWSRPHPDRRDQSDRVALSPEWSSGARSPSRSIPASRSSTRWCRWAGASES